MKWSPPPPGVECIRRTRQGRRSLASDVAAWRSARNLAGARNPQMNRCPWPHAGSDHPTPIRPRPHRHPTQSHRNAKGCNNAGNISKIKLTKTGSASVLNSCTAAAGAAKPPTPPAGPLLPPRSPGSLRGRLMHGLNGHTIQRGAPGSTTHAAPAPPRTQTHPPALAHANAPVFAAVALAVGRVAGHAGVEALAVLFPALALLAPAALAVAFALQHLRQCRTMGRRRGKTKGEPPMSPGQNDRHASIPSHASAPMPEPHRCSSSLFFPQTPQLKQKPTTTVARLCAAWHQNNNTQSGPD